MTYVFLHSFFKENFAEKLQRKIKVVEPKTALRLHKTVCGVCRLHKHRQKVIAQ
jgi:hypothetical protein